MVDLLEPSDIDLIPAGREIDLLIAEKVMGLFVLRSVGDNCVPFLTCKLKQSPLAEGGPPFLR